MKLAGLLNLKGISGQIAALVVTSLVTLHLIITATLLISRPDQPDPRVDRGHSQLATVIQLIGTAEAAARPRLIAEIGRAFPQLDIQSVAPGQPVAKIKPSGLSMGSLHRRLGLGYRAFWLESDEDTPRIGVALPDGAMISAKFVPDLRQRPLWSAPWMTTLLFAVISVTLLGLWAARALTAPLSSFARAAESFSVNGAAAPLPENGPEEIRSVARALNRMRERITALIELEPMTLVDIASTLQLVTDQFADMGHKVAYDGPEHAMATVRPDDLYRTITNLVENAVRFGAESTIRLRMEPDRVTIDVEDNGPGISDERKSVMLEPFVRGDDARNMDEATGFGLGLSIARGIVQAHGGQLSLNDRHPHGLIVRVQLPVSQQRWQSAA